MPFKHQTQATNQSKAAVTHQPPIRISPTTPMPTKHPTKHNPIRISPTTLMPTKHPTKHKTEADHKVGITDKTIGPTTETGLTVGTADIEAEAMTDSRIGAEAEIDSKTEAEAGTGIRTAINTETEAAVTDTTTEVTITNDQEHALPPEETATSQVPQQAPPTYPLQPTHLQQNLQKTKTLR